MNSSQLMWSTYIPLCLLALISTHVPKLFHTSRAYFSSRFESADTERVLIERHWLSAINANPKRYDPLSGCSRLGGKGSGSKKEKLVWDFNIPPTIVHRAKLIVDVCGHYHGRGISSASPESTRFTLNGHVIGENKQNRPGLHGRYWSAVGAPGVRKIAFSVYQFVIPLNSDGRFRLVIEPGETTSMDIGGFSLVMEREKASNQKSWSEDEA